MITVSDSSAAGAREDVSGAEARRILQDAGFEVDAPLVVPDERAALEVHLNYCDGCATFLEQIRTTAALAGGVTPEQIPEKVTEALRAAFRARQDA